MSTIRKGIQVFLQKRLDWSPYLIPKWSPILESQIIVHPGVYETEDGANRWTDGEQVWAPHRWPYKAASNPYYKDQNLTFDPAAHLHKVGSTWWNWESKRSVAVTFDIDVSGDHAPTTNTVDPGDLHNIVEKLSSLPYVTLIRSTGGKGVHIYVFFDENDQPVANNHNEHTQVALATLEKMKADLQYDLGGVIDAKGLICWFWSDTSNPSHPGYSLIKEATEQIGASDIQEYAKDIFKRVNRAVTIKGYDEDGNEIATESTSDGYKLYTLDSTHKEILRELENSGYTFIWNAEFRMAHTHTCALKELFEKRKAEGRPLRGAFETVSQGRDKNKPNCYMTPRPGGVFQVKRFGNGVCEHALWITKDGDTWCYYNQGAPVDEVLKKFSSKYDGNKMIFDARELEAALRALGHTLGEPSKNIQTPVEVTRRPDGTYWATCKDNGNFDGWKPTKSGQKRDLPVVQKVDDRKQTVLEGLDDIARHILNPDGAPCGWVLKTNIGWVPYSSYDGIAPIIRQKFGKDADFIHSTMKQNPWKLVHEPFGLEYPEAKKGEYPRLWNRNAPQLAIDPADNPGEHPHWDMIYDHLGTSLNEAVQNTPWCQEWGLESGADYLRCWLASVIKFPFEPLPYLFFYGDQNTGKSIFHESAALLFTQGSICSASGALTNSSGFNYELANVMIGYVEEKDLSSIRDGAYARMKEWVTGRTLTIHMKGETPYTRPNTLKLVQMANKPTACPMEDGDTRITAIAVLSIPKNKIVPRAIMDKHLIDEAPYFLRTLLAINLPESTERLRVPMLSTKDKLDLESINQEPWEAFASEILHKCDGNLLKFSDFYEAYYKHCFENNLEIKKSKTLLQLIRNRSNKYTVGLGKGNQMYIANVTMNPKATPNGIPFTLGKGQRLVQCIE